MSHTLMYWPMAALASLTFLVLALIPVRRFRSAFAGEVGAADFRFGESARVPGAVSIPNRNYMNLLEMPVLFYVACLMFVTEHLVDGAALALAWTYVGFRVAHSLIHVTYNNVFHRLGVFATSNFLVVAMWFYFLYKLAWSP